VKLYSTSSASTSIRRAHDRFTHILVNRGYTTIRPVFFRSAEIADLPVYVWAHWDKATAGQLERWRRDGGVLLDCYITSDRAGPADVLVFVECPMTMARIERSMMHVAEYGVIPRPHTWTVHEQAIELRTPEQSRLRTLWEICRGQRITDDELADASGLPKQVVQYQRSSFREVEEWDIRPRIAPEGGGLLEAWNWVGKGRSDAKKIVREAGHKAAIKEMNRLGYVVLKKYHRYDAAEPDWTRLEKRRQEAIAGLAAVRSLVESLPDHLQA
jgi:hypothetical protein